jgi:hypothetical protein
VEWVAAFGGWKGLIGGCLGFLWIAAVTEWLLCWSRKPVVLCLMGSNPIGCANVLVSAGGYSVHFFIDRLLYQFFTVIRIENKLFWGWF